MRITYLITRPQVTLADIAATVAPEFPQASLSQTGDKVWIEALGDDGRDYVDIIEMTRELALEEWEPDWPIMRELFHNQYLQGTSKPFYANMLNCRRSGLLLPRIVRCVINAGFDAVVLGQYGLHMPAGDFLGRWEADPAWHWDHETTAEYR